MFRMPSFRTAGSGGQVSPRSRRAGVRALAVLLATALTTSLLGSQPVQAAEDRGTPPTPARVKPVRVRPSTAKPPALAPMRRWTAPRITWPSGRAEVDPGTERRAGQLPVHLGPTRTRHRTPGRVGVEVLPRERATAAGIDGVLFTVTPRDTDGTALRVSLDYSTLRGAFGGDWASRLRLVRLPACVLTTPQRAECRRGSPVAVTNDTADARLTADVVLDPGPARDGRVSRAAPVGRAALASAAGSSSTVLAAEAGASGGAGSFTATSLKPSGSWSAGGSSGSFGWHQSIEVPAVPGGLVPEVSLDYSSQSVDGLTSATNNQASWIGDGWDYWPGYIERSYPSCADNPEGPTRTGDQCWGKGTRVTLSLSGQSTTLVRDDATGAWHPEDDNGEQVQLRTGAVNGDNDGEHWVVTTQDGTRYHFGLNRLPGWGGGNATTNSAWTAPVYATAAGQPCHSSTWAASYCAQAWRWNLDYVVDTHGNVISYFYDTETGYYARNNGSTANTPYVRGGVLRRIQYGQRDGQVYATTPAAQVRFDVTGRCTGTSCDPATLSKATAKSWPDVPADLNCANGAACDNTNPVFWTALRLSGITTQVLVGGGLQDVDTWKLGSSFPATGDATTSPSLWLDTITRTGTAGTAVTLPPVTFTGRPLINRVNYRNGYAMLTRYRISQVRTETGRIVGVDYSGPDCESGTPTPDANARRCYPIRWTPPGAGSSMLDWFNKYVVNEITDQDGTAGGGAVTTRYVYHGAPAWHRDDSPLTLASERTWGGWRGYGDVEVRTGRSPEVITSTRTTYFRGMDGDLTANGSARSVRVTDSRGGSVTDHEALAGVTRELTVRNGVDGELVSTTITDPWLSEPTASQALNGLPTLRARHVATAATRAYTPVSGGRTRVTETLTGYDAHGRVVTVDDRGDTGTSADDLCRRTTYAGDTDRWILDRVARVQTVSRRCTETPSLPADAVSDTVTLYDGSGSVGSVPGPGDVTATRQADSYDGDAPHYVTTSTTSSRDVHGRALVTADALGRVTTTAYTPATGAAPTSMTVTDPLKHTTTSVFDPRRGLMTRATTPAGLVTSWSYDGLGRVVGVWKPGQTQGVTPAGIVYEYAISASAPTTVTTKALTDGGGYRKAVTLYDALLRKRQDQTETVDGGRTVTDTVYDSHGWVVKTSDAYYTTGAPATTIAEAVDGEVPSQTGILYDAAGRRTAEIAHRYGGETWRTSYRYGGDFTTTVPPEGGTATTTLVDARGRTTALLQHHSRDNTGLVGTGDYDRTGYAYTPDGRRAGITDAAGNVWSFSYDLLGREVRKVDPDVGTTTSRYDAAGQLLSTTDARGRTVSTSYDAGGRRTAEYDTTGDREQSAENRIASWTYDTLKKGLLTSSSSYVDGAAYTTTTLGYDSAGRAKGSRLTLPTGEGKLAPSGGYVTEYTYTPTGMVESETTGAAAGLAQEKVNYGYDALGRITSVKGIWTYLDNLAYTPFDEPAVYTMPTVGGGNVWYGLSYDEQTRRLTDTVLKASDTSTEVDHTRYAYDHDGSVTRIATTRDATATDTQCFRYDHAARLSSAWTATDGCAATPETGDSGTVGGPDVYWQSWTYDVVGNRLTQTDHATGAVTRGDTTTSYSYPEAGKDAERPHALTGTGTRTGPDGQETETSRDYDAAGNTTRIATPHGTQALTWDAKGRLDTDTVTGTDEAGQVRNVYDAKGDLLLRKGPRTSTLYLGNGQVALDARTGALSATRYYRAGATTIAARTSDGHVTFLLPDRQGSDTVAVDSQTQAVRRRSYTPFGEERAATPAEWPGDRGYVGGSADPVTDLVHLGAREYDPATGRFLSGDPLLDPEDPQQLGGYAYSANTPVTKSDPTGLAPGYGDALGYGDYYAHRAWEAQMRYGGFVGPLDPSTDWGNSHAAAPGSPWTPKVTPAPSGLDKPICKAPPKPKKKRGIWGSIKKWTNDHMDEVITAVQIAAAVATVAMIVVPGLNLIALAFYATQALTWAAVAASAVQVGMDVAKGESAAKTAWDATGLIGGGLGKGAGLTARAMARTAKGASSLSGASARLSQGFADLGVRGGRAASAARKCSAGLAAQAKQVKPHIAAFEGVAASATKAENALEGVGLWMASVDGFQAMDKYFG